MKRTKLLCIRMTPDEFEAAQVEAKKTGITLSDFVRLLIRQFHNGIKFEKDNKR